MSVAALGWASALQAGVILTEKAALERAFPGQKVERRTVYLTKDQVARVEKAARSKLPSAVVTVFEARDGDRVTGRAVLDTHVVRTMPETVLTVVEPDGRLRMALVLQFSEPSDYLPRDRWLKTLEGRTLDDDLWPGRGVRRVTGATLTVQALTDAVRRSLALEALVLLLAFWATNLGMYFSRMGLRPSTVTAYYNGSEEDFRPPRSVESMLETSHMHLPMMGMVLLFLTHLVIFVPLKRPAKVAFIVITFLSALIEEGAGWLVRFVSPSFAALKVVGFVGLQSALAFLIVALAVFLFRAGRRQAAVKAAGRKDREAALLHEEGAVHAAME